MTGHSVRFDKDTAEGDGSRTTGGGGSAPGSHTGSTNRLNRRRRAPFQSQQNLNRLNRYGSRATSMYRLNHLSPSQRNTVGKSYANLVAKKHAKKSGGKEVHVPMDPMGGNKPTAPKRGLYTNKHIASAHKLMDMIPDDDPSFKTRLAQVMNTYNFQILMVVLIILDCVMVLGEMIIELRIFQNDDCKIVELHGGGAMGGHGGHDASTHISLSPHHPVIVASTLGPEMTTISGDHNGHNSGGIEAMIDEHRLHCEHFTHLMHNVEHGFHLTSIFILFLFNVELVLRLYCEGYKYFLHLEIALDALIVMISFGLDIVFLDHKMKKYLFLLIILRVWRVLRVVHAIITAIRSPFERQIEKLKKKKKILQRDLAKAYFYSNMLEEEIQNLRAIIDSFEIVEEYDDDYDDLEGGSDEKIPVCQRTVQSESGMLDSK